MKRLASEVIRDLEVRIARLEANRYIGVYRISRFASSSNPELQSLHDFLRRKESSDFELENIKLSNRGRGATLSFDVILSENDIFGLMEDNNQPLNLSCLVSEMVFWGYDEDVEFYISYDGYTGNVRFDEGGVYRLEVDEMYGRDGHGKGRLTYTITEG
tara:strand:- start:5180 stop:5656 length:477 start_codon:yes stop_codon:yes gene_type:complete